MNTMSYKGYTTSIWFDDRDDIFVGRVLGISDIVSFHADTVSELKKEFHSAIDAYLEPSLALGRPPQKPFSGKLSLRLPSELHKNVAQLAQEKQASINELIVKAVQELLIHERSVMGH